jgi:hypothetical protein
MDGYKHGANKIHCYYSIIKEVLPSVRQYMPYKKGNAFFLSFNNCRPAAPI